MLTIRCSLLAVALIAAASSAVAETTADVIKRIGLVERWGPVCDKASSMSNDFATISADSEPPLLVTDAVGQASSLRSVVEEVEIVSPTRMRIKFRAADAKWGLLNGFAFDATLAEDIDQQTKEIVRLRFMRLVRSDGSVLIREGLNFPARQPTLWMYRCDKPTS